VLKYAVPWLRLGLGYDDLYGYLASADAAVTFCLSAILLLWTARRFSTFLAITAAERYWIFTAAVMLQLGATAGLLSVVHQLTPVGWIVTQVLICMTTLYFTRPLGIGRVKQPLGTLRRTYANANAIFRGLSPLALVVLSCTCVLVGFSAIRQFATPIYIGDEKMYHASRVLYWIHNQTVFPYVSHNDRQTVSTFGSELVFLWPVLLTRTEVIGRMVFWLAFPWAALAQYFLLRSLKLTRGFAILGAFILLSTPILIESAIGLKPEIWSVVDLLGTAYWAIALCAKPDRIEMKCILLSIFAILSANTRPTALILLPVVAVLPFCIRTGVRPFLRVRGLALGLISGVAFSCLIIPVAFNAARYHNPFGPAALRRVPAADISPVQLYTHAVRFPFLLLELPDIAAPDSVLLQLETWGNHTISALGAGKPLPLEKAGWPGLFSYHLPDKATRFTLWGLFWIPVLGFGLWLLIRDVSLTWGNLDLTPTAIVSLLALTLLVEVLFGSRWMTASGVPDRFLIGPYALMVTVGLSLAATYLRGRRLAEAAGLLLLFFGAYQPLRASMFDAVKSVVAPVTPVDIDEPFHEVLHYIPDGSRILFVGDHDAPDYPLFSPRTHYSNIVIPWGKSPFDAREMRKLIIAEHITHVLVQDDRTVSFHWAPSIATGEMTDWLSLQTGFTDVHLSTPHMRLFQTRGRVRENEKYYQTTVAPDGRPLIRIADALRNRVGIDPNLMKSAWPVEALAGSREGLLWIGEGPDEGLRFVIWSRESRIVNFRFNVTAGPSRSDGVRNVWLLLDGEPVADRSTFEGSAWLEIPVRLHPGANLMHFYCEDAATVAVMPNGDKRHLLIQLRNVVVDNPSQ